MKLKSFLAVCALFSALFLSGCATIPVDVSDAELQQNIQDRLREDTITARHGVGAVKWYGNEPLVSL